MKLLKLLFIEFIKARFNRLAGTGPLGRESLVPITTHMRVLAAGRLGLVAAMSCAVLVGCGGGDPSTEASKSVKTSDGPGYSGDPDLPAMSSLSPTERSDLTVGAEANSTEFEEIATVVHGYLDASAEGDWELACSFVSPTGQRLLQGSAEKEGNEDVSCPAALPQQITRSPKELQKEASLADVGSARIGGGASRKAFATYLVANALSVMTLSGVSGEWGVTGIDPIKVG